MVIGLSSAGPKHATIAAYPLTQSGWTQPRRAETMQLQYESATLSTMRAFASPVRCPLCGDWMVAPITSEFVEGGKIRHLWECDACGESTLTSIELEDV
jgi:hypothetical protein